MKTGESQDRLDEVCQRSRFKILALAGVLTGVQTLGFGGTMMLRATLEAEIAFFLWGALGMLTLCEVVWVVPWGRGFRAVVSNFSLGTMYGEGLHVLLQDRGNSEWSAFVFIGSLLMVFLLTTSLIYSFEDGKDALLVAWCVSFTFPILLVILVTSIEPSITCRILYGHAANALENSLRIFQKGS